MSNIVTNVGNMGCSVASTISHVACNTTRYLLRDTLRRVEFIIKDLFTSQIANSGAPEEWKKMVRIQVVAEICGIALLALGITTLSSGALPVAGVLSVVAGFFLFYDAPQIIFNMSSNNVFDRTYSKAIFTNLESAFTMIRNINNPAAAPM